MTVNEQYTPNDRGQWPSLPVEGRNKRADPAKVCIASPDIYGPIKNGGIGSAYYGLAETIRDASHDVTILFQLGAESEDGQFDYWIEFYRQRNMNLVPMPYVAGTQRFPLALQRSWSSYRWLTARNFDFIIFADWSGLGYYSVLAKKCALAFSQTTLVTNTHAPTLWARLGNKKLVDNSELLLLDHLERKSVEWSDVVISPSQHLLHWMELNAWVLPERTYVQPNCLSSEFDSPEPAQAAPLPEQGSVDELVFFGRLEPRKGLIEFCNSLKRLNDDLVKRAVKVTFLGKSLADEATFQSRQFINSLRGDWDFEWQVIDNYDSGQALDYLDQPGRLAVIPSLNDNSPMTILECLNRQIPFVASDVGGIPELICEADHKACLFSPFVPSIVKFLRTILDTKMTVPRRRVDEPTNRAMWADWIGSTPAKSPACKLDSKSQPKVSVCILHHNRIDKLPRLLDSLRNQDYPNFEVILADDGSDAPGVAEFLDSLGHEFSRRGWMILKLPHRFKGYARNSAAKEASGEYLLFVDDDNFLAAGAISTWIDVALETKADILTSVQYAFDDDTDPLAEGFEPDLILHVGPAIAYGAVKNIYGDMNCLFLRTSYLQIGGVNETYGYGHEDWELFSRAALAKLNIVAVPEPLVWYQRDRNKYTRLRYQLSGYYLNNIGPYLKRLAPEENSIILLAQGLTYRNESISAENQELRHTLRYLNEEARKEKLAALAEKERRIRFEYENSSSWRFSWPVRVVKRFVDRVRGTTPR